MKKVCSCGLEYLALPLDNIRYQGDGDELSGWYWECHRCDSTLFATQEQANVLHAQRMLFEQAAASGLGVEETSEGFRLKARGGK